MKQLLQPDDGIPEGWTRIKSNSYRQGPQWQTLRFRHGQQLCAGYVYVFTDLDGSQRIEAVAAIRIEQFENYEEAIAWVECQVIAKKRGTVAT